jgi:endonuclease/exonuclease/phosphatase family metal-dependent hydrolase
MRRFSALLFAPLLAPVFALTACDLGDVPLGGDETDAFKLADTAGMKHIADVIEGGGALTFQELFERGEGLEFTDAPDPAALLTSTNTLDDARSRDGRRPLTVLTYNVALLDVDLFGLIPYAESPDLERRRRALPGLIFAKGADVVLLQEVWLDEDVEGFARRGEELGYRPFVHERASHNDGLMTFIREGAIAGGSTVEVDFQAFGSQVGTEYFPGPGIQRGWLSVRFTREGVGRVTAFNTHMQAFAENWLGRAKQAREIGIILREVAEKTGDLTLVGGDFNSGPFYSKSTWTSPDGSELDRWFHNTIAYPTMLTYGDLVDAAIMGRAENDAIADITLGNTVVNDADNALEVPGAEAGWCDRTPHVTFTASDCNTMYFDQYGGTEYPARLDHVFVNDAGDRVVVTDSQIVFTEKEQFGDLRREPSDHYGVLVNLLVSPR